MRATRSCSSLFVLVLCLSLLSSKAFANPFTAFNNKVTAAMSDLPRYQKLPLFDPRRKSFTCKYQDQQVSPSDPQAELWYQQAVALDDPDIYPTKRDYPQIYKLYLQAAQHDHWKAMLNLASLILSEHPVPEHDPEQAIRWVEKAMQLGIPDAYDRMGIYHQNGMIKDGDATSAYAFFQRAADMGSPSAMTFFGDKLGGTYDSPDGDFWGNRPIAIQMLECAVAQGDGDAADELSYLYRSPNTPTAKLQALKILQEGVRLGSSKCANNLSTEFNGYALTDGRNLVGRIDTARAERYSKIGDALEWYEGRLKLPNLDKIVPLPPASLPKWDGNKQTLIDAAKAVTAPPTPQPGASRTGREAIPEGHGVLSRAQSTNAVTGDQTVPETGYWLALYGPSRTPKEKLQPARAGFPERYRAGERFEPSSFSWLTPDEVQWQFLGDARPLPPQRDAFMSQMVRAGLLRRVPKVASPMQCDGWQRCTQTGIWASHVASDHSLALLYNRWDQQAFVEQGQPFPDPRDRFLDIATDDIRWVYLGSPNANADAPGIQKISL